MILDATTQISTVWIYATISALLGTIIALVIYVYIDFKGFMLARHSELKNSINTIHADLEPMKVKLAVHDEKIEQVEKRVETIWINQIHDNRDIQIMGAKISQIAKTA
jgi:uncharacterized membrane-anchored protein YhcB (DUF1043 family)